MDREATWLLAAEEDEGGWREAPRNTTASLWRGSSSSSSSSSRTCSPSRFAHPPSEPPPERRCMEEVELEYRLLALEAREALLADSDRGGRAFGREEALALEAVVMTVAAAMVAASSSPISLPAREVAPDLRGRLELARLSMLLLLTLRSGVRPRLSRWLRLLPWPWLWPWLWLWLWLALTAAWGGTAPRIIAAIVAGVERAESSASVDSKEVGSRPKKPKSSPPLSSSLSLPLPLLAKPEPEEDGPPPWRDSCF